MVRVNVQFCGPPPPNPPPVPLGAGVFCQPEVFQLAEILEPGELPQRGDVVLAEEELLQLLAVLEVRQRGDAVEAEGDHLHVLQPPQHADVVQVGAPAVEPLHTGEVPDPGK